MITKKHIIKITMLGNEETFCVYTHGYIDTNTVEKALYEASKYLDSEKDEKHIYETYGRYPETLLDYVCKKQSWSFKVFEPDGTVVC